MTIARVQYTEQQILRAADLTDEQEYRLAAHHRHLIGQHSWGIVEGLRLRAFRDGFVVLPGYAVDGFGRELAVPQPMFTPWPAGDQNLFDTIGSEIFEPQARQFVDVWLRYARISADPPQRGWGDCRPEPPLRSRDDAQVCLTEVRRDDRYAGPPPADAGYAPLLPIKPRAPAPHEPLPDDPRAEWPVFLGRLVRQPQDKEHPYVVDDTGRPYAGLVGESIVSASRVAVAEDPENPPTEPQPPVPSTQITARQAGERRRVAVTLADDKGALAEALALDTLSGAAIRGTARLVELPGEDNPRDTAFDLLIGPLSTKLNEADIRDPAGMACALAEFGTLFVEPAGGKTSGGAPALAPDNLLSSVPATPQLTFELPYLNPRELTQFVNNWLATPESPDLTRFANLPLRPITRALLDPANKRPQPALARRALIADLFRDQIVSSDTLAMAYGVEFNPPPAPIKAPAPWRAYSVEIERNGKMVRQLRIEIGTTGDKRHPKRNQFMIGRWSAQDNDFVPCLTVDEACTVETQGDLMVVGDVIHNPIPSEPGNLGVLGPLAEEWLREIAEGLADPANLTVEIRGLTEAAVGSAWPYEVFLKNEGASPISFIAVLENISVGKNFAARTAATIPSLPAGMESTLQITHSDPNLPALDLAAGRVTVMITVLGLGPTFNAIYVSKGLSVPIVA